MNELERVLTRLARLLRGDEEAPVASGATPRAGAHPAARAEGAAGRAEGGLPPPGPSDRVAGS